MCVTPAGTRSNRGAVGALVRFHQGGRTIRRDVMPRSMAQDFGPTSCTGLYEDGDVDVEICWPREGDGRCSFHRRLAARQTHLITEGGGEARGRHVMHVYVVVYALAVLGVR